ncbi:hypothetical protein JCM3774_002333 [Rhodotorula dairenensis]
MDALNDSMGQTSLEDQPSAAFRHPDPPSLPHRRHGPVPPPHVLRRRRSVSSDSGEEAGDNDNDDEAYGAPSSRRGPHFFPPLWLARRTACVQRLRAENVRTVADLGCGKGAVLSMLAQPAWHKDDFPELYPLGPDEVVDAAFESDHSSDGTRPEPDPHRRDPAQQRRGKQTRRDKLAVLRKVPRVRPHENELHLSRIIGVDLDRNECDAAVRVVKATSDPEANPPFAAPDRWEEARVEVYEGGVEIFNEALHGVEAIILTEVVEHLSPAALAKLPYILFSLYAPRLVIITTPNHAFNAYFPALASAPTNRNGKSAYSAEDDSGGHLFPDPTGRTNRVFRDATHTLEWTPEEFRAWCDGLLETHASDYKVSISGVGSLAAYWAPTGTGSPPFPPPSLAVHPALADHPACVALPAEPDRFFATQVAVFERQYSGEPERSPRSARPTPLPFFSPSSAPPTSLPPDSPTACLSAPRSPTTAVQGAAPLVVPKPQHELVCALTLRAHPSTRDLPSPPSLAVIREVIEAVFLSEGKGDQLSLADLWRIGGDAEIGLRAIAQGQVGRVVDALVGSPTAVPDVGLVRSDDLSEAGTPEAGDQRTVDRDDRDDCHDGGGKRAGGADEFVLLVDETKRGLDALLVRWLEYQESYRTYLAALAVVQQDRSLLPALDVHEDDRDDDETTTLKEAPYEGSAEGVLAFDERALDESVGGEQAPTAAWGRAPAVSPVAAPSAEAWTEPLATGAATVSAERGKWASWDEDPW